MGEVTFGHEVVGLDSAINVVLVDANGDSHEHVLRSLCCPSVDLEQVRTLEGLESKADITDLAQITKLLGCTYKL